jgi:hypothetical protein
VATERAELAFAGWLDHIVGPAPPGGVRWIESPSSRAAR